MQPVTPPREVLQAIAALWGRTGRGGDVAELYLRIGSSLTIDWDPASGLLQENLGGGSHATVRVWSSEGFGRAEGWWSQVEDLEELLAAARASARPGGAPPVLEGYEALSSEGPPAGAPSVERARALALQWARELQPLGTRIQALLVQQSLGWCGLFHSSGFAAHEWMAREQALVRCETPEGALVDGVAAPRLEGGVDPSRATARLSVALEALRGERTALDPSLPLVLRPLVAGPLVSGLAWALRGDVAAAAPALARAVGKKIFPSVLSVRDDPRHPEGTVLRAMDDEGRRAAPVTSIESGRLLGFFHSHASAARLGTVSNGRAVRADGGEPSPGTFNLHIVPGSASMPADRTELTCRVETFTTMRQPGVVSLLAAGWEYRGGARQRHVGPLELELPVLATFRQLQAVGSDLTFLPTSDGCGTPTLILSPPTWLGDSASK